MDNYDKNEKMKSINSTKSSSNINIEDDLNDLIKYGRWELSLISSLKSEKNYKKNLLVINKDWLSNWKEITGYNFIKNKIFQYLVVTQKNKNDTKKIEEETKKLNELWLNIKLKNNINISNIKNIPKIDNKKYLLHVNNKTLINSFIFLLEISFLIFSIISNLSFGNSNNISPNSFLLFIIKNIFMKI